MMLLLIGKGLSAVVLKPSLTCELKEGSLTGVDQ